MEIRIEIVIQIIVAVFMGFLGLIIKWLKDDMTTIRKERAQDHAYFMNHINDHSTHCKHPAKGC